MPLNEGQTVQYTVVTTRVADGTVLYWKTTGNTTNSDIVGGNTGSIVINNNRAVFNVAIVTDVNTDGTKTLGIALSTGSISGPTVVSTANPIIVEDTSLSPVNRIYAWGDGTFGSLGLNDRTNRSSPTQIGSDTTWTDISSGAVNALAIKNGMLLTWGGNYQGRLGLNDTVARSSPTQVGSDTNWSTVTAGLGSCFAIKTNGTLWSWGNGSYGILGLNLPNGTYKSSPIQVGTDTNWSQIEAREHALAIKTDGTLWSWGFNNLGQLGQNFAVPDSTSSPTQIGSDSTWSKIATYGSVSMAIKTNGTLWAWGWSTFGTLGQNNTNSASSPTQIGSLTNWSSVALGSGNAVAVKNDGTLWAWGLNSDGQLGLNNVVNKSSPTQVGTDTTWSNCFAAEYHVSVLKTNNTLWTWGSNNRSLLGQNDTIFRSSPTQVGALNTWKQVAMGQYQNFGFEGS